LQQPSFFRGGHEIKKPNIGLIFKLWICFSLFVEIGYFAAASFLYGKLDKTYIKLEEIDYDLMSEIWSKWLTLYLWPNISFLILVLVGLYLLYTAWKAIDDGKLSQPPATTAGLMLIPMFNIYWIFQAVGKYAGEYNSFISRRNIPSPRLNEKMFFVFSAVYAVGTFVKYIIMLWEYLAGYPPVITSIFMLFYMGAWLGIGIYIISEIKKGLNALEKAGAFAKTNVRQETAGNIAPPAAGNAAGSVSHGPQCAACGSTVRGNAKFCTICGSPALAAEANNAEILLCSSCGVTLPGDAKFCEKCGSPVQAAEEAPELTAAESASMPGPGFAVQGSLPLTCPNPSSQSINPSNAISCAACGAGLNETKPENFGETYIGCDETADNAAETLLRQDARAQTGLLLDPGAEYLYPGELKEKKFEAQPINKNIISKVKLSLFSVKGKYGQKDIKKFGTLKNYRTQDESSNDRAGMSTGSEEKADACTTKISDAGAGGNGFPGADIPVRQKTFLKKQIFWLALVLFVVLAGAAFGIWKVTQGSKTESVQTENNPAKETVSEQQKNDAANDNSVVFQGNNIINGGLVAQQGEWIYYRNASDGFKLYKVRTDGSGRTRLNDDASLYVNEADGWVYYMNASDGFKLYKVRTDGSGRVRLNEDRSYFVNVADGWVYYSNANDGDKIYRIRTDGSGRTRLSDGQSYFINVAAGWVYYINNSDGGKVYKIRTDGSGRTGVNSDESWYICVADGWVYYSNHDDGDRLYKIRTDGSGRTRITDDIALHINVAGGWVYYANANDSGRLYKVRTDGSGRVRLNDDAFYHINMAGEWIYYMNENDGGQIFKIRTDGSGKMVVQ
jgi:ribosomal protein L40E